MVCRALLETKSAAFGLGTNFFSQLVMNTQHLEEGIPELGLISDRILFPAMRATLATINVYFPDKYWGAYHQTYESKLSNNDYEEATLKKEAGKIIDQYFVRYFVKAGSSAWDVIYDAKMRIPGFIAQVENIGNGLATLFFGKPEWPYRYVPLYAIYNDLSLYNTAKDALKAAFSQETVSKIYDLYEDFKTYLNEQEELYQIKAIHPESIGANPLNVNNINHIYDTIFEFDGQRAAVFVEGYEPLDYNGDDVEKISINGLGEVNYIPYQEDESKEAVYLDLTGWKIYDGDTLIPDTPELENQYKSIRFLGIDAPEVNSSDEDEKKKGETARDFLKLLLEAGGCYVKYYKDGNGKTATDYYDRDLGNIFIDVNGKKYNASVLMTANGMANYYNSSHIGTEQEDAIKQGVFFANLNNLGKFSGDSSIGSQIQQIITNAQMSDANIYYKEVNPTTWKLYLYHEPDYTIDVSKIMDEDNYFMIERSSFEEVQDRKQIGSDKLIDKLNRVNTRIETAYTNVHTTYDLIRKQISDFQQLNANFQFNPYTQAKDDTIEELTAKELVLTEVIARYDNAYYLLKDHIENIYVAITESKGDMYYQHAVMWQNDMLAYPTSEEAKPFYEFFEISNDFQKEMKLIVGSASQSLSVLFKLNQLSLAIERKEKNDLSQAGLLQKHPAQIPGYRTFRREWVISDKFNLLANTVVATKTNMWNEVTFFSKDISYPIWRVFASIWNFSRNMLTPDKGEGVTIDGDKYRVYSVLFDEDIEQSDRMERQIVDENQADTQVRAILGSTYLQKGIEQMYGGVLQITGNPEIKPNDIIHLYDSHIGLSGMLKVKNVTHSLTPNGGFTTYIEPVAVTEVRDVLTLYGAQLKHHALTSVLGITLFAAGVGLGAVLTGGIGLFATIGGLLTASNANLLMSAFMGNWNYSATNEYYLDGNKAGVVITNKEAFNTIAVSPLSLNGVPYTAGLRGTEFDAYGRWDLKLERSAEYWNNFVTGLTDWGDMKDIWKNSTQWVANSYYKMELINQHFTTETGTYTNNMKNVNFGG
jgi:endonuclease YncB( thermonuclease family)